MEYYSALGLNEKMKDEIVSFAEKMDGTGYHHV
jgi:hypothetical protein